MCIHRNIRAGNCLTGSPAAASARVVFGAWAQASILLFPGNACIAPAATACSNGRSRSLQPSYFFRGEVGDGLVHKQREEVGPDAQQHQQEEAVLDGN